MFGVCCVRLPVDLEGSKWAVSARAKGGAGVLKNEEVWTLNEEQARKILNTKPVKIEESKAKADPHKTIEGILQRLRGD